MELDDFLISIGGISSLQIRSIVISVGSLFVASSLTQVAILFSAIPNHRCKLYDEDNDWGENLTQTPASSCFINQSSDPMGALDGTIDGSPCQYGWVYSKEYYKKTTISQWDLVCDRQILDALSNSIVILGYLFGSLLAGFIGDWFGRKRAYIGFVFFFFVFNVAITFSKYLWIFLLLRFFVGIGMMGTILSVYAYVFEILDNECRRVVNVICVFITAFSHFILPLVVLVLPHWQYLNLLYSAILFPTLCASFFVAASPRWLLTNGKEEEAKQVLRQFAACNNAHFSEKLWDRVVENFNSKIGAVEAKSKRYSTLDLFRAPLTAAVSVLILLAWFVVNLVFFGLMLNGTNLFGNPFLNTTLNGLAEIVAAILFLLGQNIGERPKLVASFALSGVLCLVSIIQQYEHIALIGAISAIIGKVFATLAFSEIYFLTMYTFPTKIRSIAMSTGSAVGRISGIVTPFIIHMQFIIPWVTPTIFGILSILTGFACLLLPNRIPELLNSTLDEAEILYGKHMTVCKRLFRIKPRDDKKFGTVNTVASLVGSNHTGQRSAETEF